MKAKNYELMMDIYNGVLTPKSIQFTTEDFGMCSLTFDIVENMITPYNLTDCIVRMLINGQQQDCTILDATNGKVTITLLQSMLKAGQNIAELQIYDATNQILRITTPTFMYSVRRSLMTPENVQADPNYTILQNMILEVSNANEVANNAKTVAEGALSTANQAQTKATEIMANGDYAKAQGDYAKAKGDEVANKITLNSLPQTNFNFTGTDKAITGLKVGEKQYSIPHTTYEITDRAGRLQEEINRTFYKRSCKEFTSTGGKITVPNGEKGYVLSGEIKGQTVKQLVKGFNIPTTLAHGGTYLKEVKFQQKLEIGKVYTIIHKVSSSMLTTGKIQLQGLIQSVHKVLATGVGVQATTVTPTDIRDSISLNLVTSSVGDSITVEYLMIFEGDLIGKIDGYIDAGLSSTQAILNNNGASYPIYEPAIKGTATGLAPTIVFSPVLPTLMTGDVLDLATKTITFANATTKVLTDEQMKAYSTYKKVILLPFAEDKATLNEDGSGTWNKAYNQIVLNGSENWVYMSMIENKVAQIGLDISDMKYESKLYIDKASWTGLRDWSTTNSHYTTSNNNRLYAMILLSELGLDSTATSTVIVNAYKNKLKSENLTCVYQTLNSAITTIDKSIMPVIQTSDKINICQVESSVAPSSFKLTLPVDINGEQNAAISSLQTAVALLQQQVLTLQAFHK